MAEQRDRIRWPDGLYASYTPSFPAFGLVGVGGNYYWNPGSPDAPSATVTGMLGKGRDVPRLPFGALGPLNFGVTYLRKGMTSADTLGPGTTTNVSTILPSVSVNSSFPVENSVPRLDKAKVSSIEAGLSGSIGASSAGTYTVTPQEVADFVSRNLVTPAMGPMDELSPFARTLRSGVGRVGAPSAPPIRYLSSGRQNPFGDEMGDWRSSVNPVDRPRPASPEFPSPIFDTGAPPIPYLPASQSVPRGLPAMLAEAGGFDPSNPEAPPAGGLPGLIQEHLRNH